MKSLIAIALLMSSTAAVAAPEITTLTCREAQLQVRAQGWKNFIVEGQKVTFYATPSEANLFSDEILIKPFVATADSSGCVVGYAKIDAGTYPRDL